MQPKILCLRNPCRLRNHLRVYLIHRNGRCQHAAPHIGNLRHLQKPLNRTVLAPCAMQHGNHHIHRDFLHIATHNFQKAFLRRIRRKAHGRAEFFPFSCFHMLYRPVVNQPLPFFRNPDRQYLIFFLIQCLQHHHRRGSGNLMLGGLSSKNHCNRFLADHTLVLPASDQYFFYYMHFPLS